MAHENEMSHVVERNIDVLMKRRKKEERKKTTEEKIADSITHFTGSMLFVYLHLMIFGVWIVWNSGIINVPRFDPSYVILAMFASVEAIFLSTFVLISQNRMTIEADKRAELDLQITLLTEHEVTRLASMIGAIAEKVGAEIPKEVDLSEISKDVRPENVMDVMESRNKPKE
ncbi:MAG: DUF1003 domain-containing protein [Flavobacterium sp.]|nr:MAG: DUF1003 domain-containing protein [Flavobacterium sp.]